MSLEEKKIKFQELQNQLTKQQELQQQIAILENFVKKYLDAKAISRLGNIKTAHPEKALQVIAFIAQSVQAGQIKAKLNDMQFRELLMMIQPKKNETKIIRK
ncbi:MAG: DNA-binding protein [Nanoarchaeota archaeon]|nr:DNA-binding protein [Nanoarchaeota archaeon]